MFSELTDLIQNSRFMQPLYVSMMSSLSMQLLRLQLQFLNFTNSSGTHSTSSIVCPSFLSFSADFFLLLLILTKQTAVVGEFRVRGFFFVVFS